ncbi:hypothetical protein WN944_005911 [Citrus x changshan-huyou]|uniref:Uncharacterized protein n=1 Tax=Citrus x changshan-huyou TaxID=2935761 RepID=A0AAP0MPJ7_9ROSI
MISVTHSLSYIRALETELEKELVPAFIVVKLGPACSFVYNYYSCATPFTMPLQSVACGNCCLLWMYSSLYMGSIIGILDYMLNGKQMVQGGVLIAVASVADSSQLVMQVETSLFKLDVDFWQVRVGISCLESKLRLQVESNCSFSLFSIGR